MSNKPSPETILALAAVRARPEELEQAAEQGRELRRAFEERIAEMRNVTPDDLKSRSR